MCLYPFLHIFTTLFKSNNKNKLKHEHEKISPCVIKVHPVCDKLLMCNQIKFRGHDADRQICLHNKYHNVTGTILSPGFIAKNKKANLLQTSE